MHVEDGPVRRLVFDRPGVQNAMTAAVARDLADALEATDPDAVDVVVITGEGDAFSAGGDIEAMAERDETTTEAYERVRSTVGRVAEAMLTLPVPVVTKVNGDAVGAGTSLVAAADFAFASDDARFGASFVNVGLVPDLGGTVLLPRILGLRRTKELVFTGQLVSADEAAELDLINESVPGAELDDRVAELVDTLQNRPTETIGLAKQAIHDNLGQSWRDGLDHEAQVQSQAYDTDAHAEGVAAFLDECDPEFD